MLRYTPQDEPNTERAFLVVFSKSEYGQYAHLNARLVRLAKPHVPGESSWNDDGEKAKGWRNTSWSNGTKSAVFVEDFMVHCQMDIPKYIPYGSDIRFEVCGSVVERRTARLMTETFSKVDKGLAKIAASFGDVYSEDYSGLLLRIAEVLKVKWFLFYRDESDRRDLETADFKRVSPGNLKWEIERRLESRRPKVETAETLTN